MVFVPRTPTKQRIDKETPWAPKRPTKSTYMLTLSHKNENILNTVVEMLRENRSNSEIFIVNDTSIRVESFLKEHRMDVLISDINLLIFGNQSGCVLFLN
jgi:hypothetical protein